MKSKIVAFGVLMVLALGMLVFSGCAPKEVTPTMPETPAKTFTGTITGETKTYSNAAENLEIDYPADWELQEGFMGTVAVFLSPAESEADLFQENLNIGTQDLSATPMSLASYTEINVLQIEELITDSEVLESTSTTLAGNPAHVVVYTGAQGVFTLKWLQVWTIKDNMVYMLTYTAEEASYNKFMSSIEGMINSFKIM